MPYKKKYKMDHHNWRVVDEEIVRRDLADFYDDVNQAIKEMKNSPGMMTYTTTWADFMWVEEE